MTAEKPEIVLDRLVFPEGPRWRDGRLWFSDQHGYRVVAMDPDGTAETVVEVAQQPSGLGWLPNGDMLIVSMLDRRVLRLDASGALRLHADLSSLAPGQCNDMVVDTSGRAYVGNFGFDMDGGERARDTHLIAVEPDGHARLVADGLGFPNGTVITDDGRTLLVGESTNARITAFDIAGDGSLSNPRVWAQLAGSTVDGMCLDAEGAIWAACPFTGRVQRVVEGGQITHEIRGSHPGVFACMLGGDDRRTLYLCTAPSHVPAITRAEAQGRIEAITVDTPGAGLP